MKTASRIHPKRPLAPIISAHTLGFFLFLCLLIGGGTDQNLNSDNFILIVSIPFIFLTIRDIYKNLICIKIKIFLVIILLSVILQLVPTFGLTEKQFFISIDGGRTLVSFLIVLCWASIFFRTALLDLRGHTILFVYLIFGAFLSFIISFVQFSSSTFSENMQVLPFKINAGFFANENHLSALLYSISPAVLVLCIRYKIQILGLFIILILILNQFVIGSKAGVILIIVSGFLIYGIRSKNIYKRILFFSPIILISIISILAVYNGIEDVRLHQLSRITFAQRTWEAILNNFPFGIGYGNFILVYSGYEKTSEIFEYYVNHAHNDYLELLLEGSLMAAILILIYFYLLCWWAVKHTLSDMGLAALVAIVLLMSHSIVDYPLRTLALGTMFAAMNGIYFSRSQSKRYEQ